MRGGRALGRRETGAAETAVLAAGSPASLLQGDDQIIRVLRAIAQTVPDAKGEQLEAILHEISALRRIEWKGVIEASSKAADLVEQRSANELEHRAGNRNFFGVLCGILGIGTLIACALAQPVFAVVMAALSGASLVAAIVLAPTSRITPEEASKLVLGFFVGFGGDRSSESAKRLPRKAGAGETDE